MGDWIVFNGLTLYINEIVKGYYRTISKGGITNSYDWDIDNLARLWSIEEANIGDILTASDKSIFIYAGLNGVLVQSYIALLADGDLNTMKCNWEENTSVSPATKEQQDLLFAKMKKEGYEWDSEKKELWKIDAYQLSENPCSNCTNTKGCITCVNGDQKSTSTPRILYSDEVIEWLKTKVYDDSTYGMAMIEKFKKDFGL